MLGYAELEAYVTQLQAMRWLVLSVETWRSKLEAPGNPPKYLNPSIGKSYDAIA
jgi:hypothetical protein